jgi:hypothetical protein
VREPIGEFLKFGTVRLIPATASAYSLNVTAVPRGGLSYLTSWPAGQAMPLASTLNSFTGAVTANAAIVPAGTNGAVNMYPSDDTDLVIDINGYFAPPGTGGLSLYTVSPCRVADTRNPAGPYGGPSLNGQRSVAIASSGCTVPSAAAYSLNATVVPKGYLGYLTLWSSGGTQPLVSTLNAFDGTVTSNAALVPAGNGAVSAFTSELTDLVLDINGYFAP